MSDHHDCQFSSTDGKQDSKLTRLTTGHEDPFVDLVIEMFDGELVEDTESFPFPRDLRARLRPCARCGRKRWVQRQGTWLCKRCDRLGGSDG